MLGHTARKATETMYKAIRLWLTLYFVAMAIWGEPRKLSVLSFAAQCAGLHVRELEVKDRSEFCTVVAMVQLAIVHASIEHDLLALVRAQQLEHGLQPVLPELDGIKQVYLDAVDIGGGDAAKGDEREASALFAKRKPFTVAGDVAVRLQGLDGFGHCSYIVADRHMLYGRSRR